MSEPIKRALVISPTPTWPLNFGNRKRIFMVCSKLKSLGFEIHFVHYASETDWRSNIPTNSRRQMNSQWDMVDHVFPSIDLHCSPKDGLDHTIDEWWDPVLENFLKFILKNRDFDVVIVNYTWLSRALEFVPKGILKVLDTHDKFTDRRLLLESNGISKEYFHTTAAQEKIGISRADLIWSIKDEERVFFESLQTKKCIQTLIYIDEYRESPGSIDVNGYLTAGFIGARNNINKVNITNFVDVALPIFEKYLPPLKIKIAGSVCDDLAAVNSSYFEIVGRVDDVDDFYDAIDLAIVPMDFSAGLKIKSGEAISKSKPLIAHEHAMEGYPATHRLHECSSLEQIALELCRLAYDSSDVNNLKSASVESYKIIQEEIDAQLNRISQVVNLLRDVIIILPREFGDESKIIHWHARTMVEWLSWEFNILCISQYSDSSCQSVNVRFLDLESIKELIFDRKKAVVFNLDEYFSCEFIFDRSKTFSHITDCSVIKREGMLFASSVEWDRDRLFGFGHLKIPIYSDGIYANRSGALILGESTFSKRLSIKQYLQTCSRVTVSDTSFSNYEEMQDYISDYVMVHQALPKYVISLKPFFQLTYAEQLFVDFLLSHEGKYLNCYGLIDITHLLNTINNDENYYNDYQNQFFHAWKLWEIKILSLQTGATNAKHIYNLGV
ncbi:glycosyltransferase family 4 protein [Sessilibacter sp. MAH2]